MAKRRGKSWGPSNPLWRWQHRKSSSTKRGRTMARRTRKGRRYSRGGGLGLKNLLMGGALYGVARSPVANVVAPIVAKVGVIPATLTDEVGMGIVDYLVAKNMSGVIRDAAKAGLTIEAARVAETFTSGIVGGAAATPSGNIF